MRTSEECYACLESLIRKNAEQAETSEDRRRAALEAGLSVLKREFPHGRIPAQIAGEAQRVVREVTGDPDPFRAVKEREMKLASEMFQEVRRRFGDDLLSLIKLAALGNAVDFFKDTEEVAADMQAPVEFALDATGEFAERAAKARRILYLADNASECYFDLPLVQELERRAVVYYCVKSSPVQNDLTVRELEQAGFTRIMKNIITTGTNTPGLDLELASEEFCGIFRGVDLVLAKGMGYYETLPEIKERGAVFHVLMAKCAPVARSLGVPRHSYVATFC